jgi:hypothetical protein
MIRPHAQLYQLHNDFFQPQLAAMMAASMAVLFFTDESPKGSHEQRIHRTRSQQI